MNPLVERALFAALPVLGLALGIREGFLVGALGSGALVAATLIFLLLHPAIPERLHRLSFLLLLLVLGILAGEVSAPARGTSPPLLLVSLWLLTLPDLFRQRKNWVRVAGKTLLLGLAFWILLGIHGLFADFLGRQAGIRFFQLPGGSYLLLGLWLVFARKA